MALLTAALLAGCGSSEERPRASDPPETRLLVAYDPGDGQLVGPGKAQRLTVACPGHALCARLAKLPAEAFEPVPPNVPCTAIFGGEQTATVRGTLRGRRIDARFTRRNGCEIARWERVQWLFEPRGG